MIYSTKRCKIRPRYIDGDTVHPYCGKGCAKLAKGKQPAPVNTPMPLSPPLSPTPTASTDEETTPGTDPFISPFPFSIPGFAPDPRGSIISTNRYSLHRSNSLIPPCRIPECPSRVFVDRKGVAGHYCSKAHLQWVSHYLVPSRERALNDP